MSGEIVGFLLWLLSAWEVWMGWIILSRITGARRSGKKREIVIQWGCVLGLGVLLGAAVVAVWSLWVLRARLLTIARRHGWLLFVCACLTAFAVSYVVTANGATLFRIPLPQALVELATTLRSSGRLFWPVYYLIMLAAVAGLMRLCGALRFKHAGVAVLACLCVVQLVDLSPALAQKAASLREYSPIETDLVTGTTPALSMTTDFFETVSGRYDTLIALDTLTQTDRIADEPLANLDLEVRPVVFDAITRRRTERSMAALLVTNDAGFIRELAAETLLLRAGHVVARGIGSNLIWAPNAEGDVGP